MDRQRYSWNYYVDTYTNNNAREVQNRTDLFEIYLDHKLRYLVGSGEANYIFNNRPELFSADSTHMNPRG
jgi:hypothetical protein